MLHLQLSREKGEEFTRQPVFHAIRRYAAIRCMRSEDVASMASHLTMPMVNDLI